MNDVSRELYRELGINDKVIDISEEVLGSLKDRFAKIDENADYCTLKVLRAFQKNNVMKAVLWERPVTDITIWEERRLKRSMRIISIRRTAL